MNSLKKLDTIIYIGVFISPMSSLFFKFNLDVGSEIRLQT